MATSSSGAALRHDPGLARARGWRALLEREAEAAHRRRALSARAGQLAALTATTARPLAVSDSVGPLRFIPDPAAGVHEAVTAHGLTAHGLTQRTSEKSSRVRFSWRRPTERPPGEPERPPGEPERPPGEPELLPCESNPGPALRFHTLAPRVVVARVCSTQHWRLNSHRAPTRTAPR